MGFLKSALLSFLVFSTIIIAMSGFIGDLNSYYGTSISGISENDSMAGEVENLSIEIRNTMKPSEVSSTTGMGILDAFTLGGSIIANTFSLMIVGIPRMFVTLNSYVAQTIGLPGWTSGIILTAVGVLLTAAVIKFVLRRDT